MMLSYAAVFLFSVLAGDAEKTIELESNERLCVAWCRAAIQMISEPNEPTPENYEGALELAKAAVSLVPNNKECLRVLLEIASATSAELPYSQKVVNETILQLAKLDPDDQVLRIARLNDAIDRYTTAEDRIKAYEHFLQPLSVEKISSVVASRLSYDFSLLLRRRGDVDAAIIQLREAIKLDPAFPIATAQWAAYQLECNAPPGIVANALVDAILANPSEIIHLKELSMMCLQEGLYEEANFLLSIACQVADKNSVYEEYDGLLAKQMLALWGLGKHKQAADVFTTRHNQVKTIFENKFRDAPQANSEIQLPLTLNVIHAIVTKSGSLPSAEAAWTEALGAFDIEIKNSNDDPAKKAGLLLEKSWVTLGVGPDFQQVPSWIEDAETFSPLSTEAKAKFNGWLELRGGKTMESLAILKPLPESDSLARLGYALACAKNGQTKEAAQEFAGIIKRNRSDIIGLYAADQLFEIIKKRFPPSAKAPEIQSAVARLPKNFGDLAKNLNQFIQVGATFLSRTATPFDSLPCKIEITNLSSIPLSITADGPIRTQAAILLETIILGTQQGIVTLPPVIFSIDRCVQIPPKGTMSFVIDMAYDPAILPLIQSPLNGSTLQMELVTNFSLSLENVVPGFLGKITAPNNIRISPITRDQAWREDALGKIRHCETKEDLVTLVLFAFDLATRSTESGAEEEVKEGWTELTEAWKRLPPAAQAWTLMVLPREPFNMTEPITKAAKESQNRLIQMSAILRWTDSDTDPLLNTITRGTDQQLIAVAASMRSLIATRLHDIAQYNQSIDEAKVLGGESKASDVPQSDNPRSTK